MSTQNSEKTPQEKPQEMVRFTLPRYKILVDPNTHVIIKPLYCVEYCYYDNVPTGTYISISLPYPDEGRLYIGIGYVTITTEIMRFGKWVFEFTNLRSFNSMIKKLNILKKLGFTQKEINAIKEYILNRVYV